MSTSKNVVTESSTITSHISIERLEELHKKIADRRHLVSVAKSKVAVAETVNIAAGDVQCISCSKIGRGWDTKCVGCDQILCLGDDCCQPADLLLWDTPRGSSSSGGYVCKVCYKEERARAIGVLGENQQQKVYDDSEANLSPISSVSSPKKRAITEVEVEMTTSEYLTKNARILVTCLYIFILIFAGRRRKI